MGFWWIPIIFGAIFAISFGIDKRRFRNAILFLFLLCTIYLAVISSLGRSHAVTYVMGGSFIAVALLILVVTVMLIADGILSLKREGFGLSNMLSILFVVCMWLGFFVVVSSFAGYGGMGGMAALSIFIILAELYIIVTFVALFLYSLLYRLFPKKKHCDYIIVHGAGLLNGDQVSPLLAGRLDKGIKVYERGGSKAKIIVSGGQGGDETVSEASAMAAYLLNKGIPEDHILLEDKSKTTFENMENSKEIVEEDAASAGIEKPSVIFVTSDYHVFRTGTYARKVGLKAEGVGSKTAAYYFPNAFIREYIAVMVKHKVAPLILLGLCILIIIIL